MSRQYNVYKNFPKIFGVHNTYMSGYLLEHMVIFGLTTGNDNEILYDIV